MRVIKQCLAWVLTLLFLIPLGSAPVEAATLTGKYAEDGLTVIGVMRASIQVPRESEDFTAAQAEAEQAMNGFVSRYHGERYDKKQSFTTLRTVFNTVATNYHSPRPLAPEKVQRILAQLDRAQQGVEVGN